MKIQRRGFLRLAVGVAALSSISGIVTAQPYPSRPVRIIVGISPGGQPDIVARLFAQWLSERLGQPFVVENRPGAGTNIATEAVVRAAPDGYTLLLTGSPNAINATLYDKLSFNFIRDIAPVASFVRPLNVMVVPPSVPARTVPEFIAYARANPGKLNMAAPGKGSGPHLYGELFKAMAGIDMARVYYRGGGQVVTDLITGQVQVAFIGLEVVSEHVKADKLRLLAVGSATRSDVLPDVPAMAEFVPGYEASAWFGIGAPKGTPPEIIEKLNKEINAILADPKTRARVAELGGTVLAGSPADFAKRIADDTEKMARVIRAANIKVE